MSEKLIQDIILLLGPIVLFSISLFSIIGMSFLVSTEKNLRSFFIILLLLSTSLSGYIIFDFLLGFFGFDTGNPQRIEQNKNIIITFSRLEIVGLTMGIILFSSISTIFIKNLFSKIKLIVVTLIGAYIIYLDFFSPQFFLQDTLKLNINKYMAKEGPLFDIFVSFFAITVLFETIYLSISKNKIDLKYLQTYPPVMYGLAIIIFFGILEALELYDLIQIYPYLPSLLGTGISLFSLVVLTLLLNKYTTISNENKIMLKLLLSTQTRIKENTEKVSTHLKESITSIEHLNKKINEVSNLPSITKLTIDKINNSFSKIKNKITEIKTSTTSIIDSLSTNITTITSEIQKFNLLKANETILEVMKQEREVINNIKNIKFIETKQSSTIEFLSSASNLSIIDILNSISSTKDYIDECKVKVVNLIIASEKNLSKDAKFSQILANEILEKITKIRETFENITNNISELNKINETIMVFSQTVKTSEDKIINLNIYQNIQQNINEFDKINTIAQNLIKSISNIIKIEEKAISTTKNLKEILSSLENNINYIFNFVQETQTIYEQFFSLNQTISEITQNINELKEIINQFYS